MAYHEKFITSIKEIVLYYKNRLNEEDVGADVGELHKRCWHCGDISKLYRCHIIPSSAGGQDVPNNYVLLCRRCHEQAPNCTAKEIMMSWLKSDSAKIYDMYWGTKIYEQYNKIYNTNFIDEYNLRYEVNSKLLKDIIYKQFNEIKLHIGSGHINLSTWVGLFKMAFDDFDKNI